MKSALFLLGAALATAVPSAAATLTASDYSAIGLVNTLSSNIGNGGKLTSSKTKISTGKYYLTGSTYGNRSTLYAPSAEADFNSAWIDNTSDYSWLTISIDGNTTVDRLAEVNSFTVSLTFDLTDYEDISFDVNLTYDDLIEVYLNGTSIYSGSSGAYTSFSSSFTFDSSSSTYSSLLTESGQNTFTFVVTNSSDKTTSATGFAVTFSNLASVPEPATYGVLFGIGALSLVLWQRRRRKSSGAVRGRQLAL